MRENEIRAYFGLANLDELMILGYGCFGIWVGDFGVFFFLFWLAIMCNFSQIIEYGEAGNEWGTQRQRGGNEDEDDDDGRGGWAYLQCQENG